MNMRRIFMMITASLLIMTSCKTPNIVVSNRLKSNTQVYEVKGRQGWQFNQVIRYGDYSTSKVKRGWTNGYKVHFIADFKKASEKLSYTQSIPSGKNVFVECIGRFESTDIPRLIEIFGIPVDMSMSLKYEDYFAGSIYSDDINWDFILYNPDNNTVGFGENSEFNTSGEIINLEGDEKIIIRPIRKVEGQMNPKLFERFALYGFEFIENGRAIAAVSLINNGRVWISNDLNEEKQLVISSVMTGLMVRHSMSESLSD